MPKIPTNCKYLYLEACDFVTCNVVGEKCQRGVCMCGTTLSCEENSKAPTCDPINNRCVCGSIGYALAGCTDPDEVCVEGQCQVCKSMYSY